MYETEPPAPVKPVVNPFAIERPHAAPHLLERQGSFRGLSQLNQSSPFKRQMSLRIGDLPSTVERQQNSLSNEAPTYKSTLATTPGKKSASPYMSTPCQPDPPPTFPAMFTFSRNPMFMFYSRFACRPLHVFVSLVQRALNLLRESVVTVSNHHLLARITLVSV